MVHRHLIQFEPKISEGKSLNWNQKSDLNKTFQSVVRWVHRHLIAFIPNIFRGERVVISPEILLAIPPDKSVPYTRKLKQKKQLERTRG